MTGDKSKDVTVLAPHTFRDLRECFSLGAHALARCGGSGVFVASPHGRVEKTLGGGVRRPHDGAHGDRMTQVAAPYRCLLESVPDPSVGHETLLSVPIADDLLPRFSSTLASPVPAQPSPFAAAAVPLTRLWSSTDARCGPLPGLCRILCSRWWQASSTRTYKMVYLSSFESS
jgi:hypothetical protein